MREAKRPAELRRQRAAHGGGAEQPEFRDGGGCRCGGHAVERMTFGEVVGQETVEVDELFRKLLGADEAATVGQHLRGAAVAAGRTPDSEVDAARIKRL